MCRSAFLSCDSLFHLRRLLWALKLFLMSHFGSLVLRLLTTFFPRLDENRQLTRQCHSGSSFTQSGWVLLRSLWPDRHAWVRGQDRRDLTCFWCCRRTTSKVMRSNRTKRVSRCLMLRQICSMILSKKSIKYLRSYFNRNNLKLRRTNFTDFGFHQVYTATQTLLLDSHGSVSRWSLTIKGSSFLLTFVLGFNKTLGKSRRTLRFCFHSEDSGGKEKLHQPNPLLTWT